MSQYNTGKKEILYFWSLWEYLIFLFSPPVPANWTWYVFPRNQIHWELSLLWKNFRTCFPPFSYSNEKQYLLFFFVHSAKDQKEAFVKIGGCFDVFNQTFFSAFAAYCDIGWLHLPVPLDKKWPFYTFAVVCLSFSEYFGLFQTLNKIFI